MAVGALKATSDRVVLTVAKNPHPGVMPMSGANVTGEDSSFDEGPFVRSPPAAPQPQRYPPFEPPRPQQPPVTPQYNRPAAGNFSLA